MSPGLAASPVAEVIATVQAQTFTLSSAPNSLKGYTQTYHFFGLALLLSTVFGFGHGFACSSMATG
jgi:hypothetical protein